MFRGFEEVTIQTGGAEIFLRKGGAGPAVLMLHGYPQTSAMWHEVAPELAKTHSVICADLRGYGRSSKPQTTPDHAPYSKRAMAADMLEVMTALGHETFSLVGHDRGGRVAHRLAMDARERVERIAVLDIAPTREMYAATDDEFARAYWHWFYLIRPYPMPERMIGADPEAFWCEKGGGLSGGYMPFAKDALAEYLQAFVRPETIHASCEDYRAAASIDIDHDNADGDAKLPMPLLVLWGSKGVIERCFDPLHLWSLRAENVSGKALPTGHFMAEEDPKGVLAELEAFLQA